MKLKLWFKTNTIIVIICICICIPIFILGLRYINFIIETQTYETNVYLSEVSAQSANSIINEVDGNISTLKAISTYIGELPELDKVNLSKLLMRERANGKFKRLYFINQYGIGFGIAENGGYVDNVDFSQREYLKTVFKGENAISPILDDILSDKLVHAYAVPVYKNGDIIGCLSGVNNADEFQDLLTIFYFNNTGYSMIISIDGNIIISPQNIQFNSNLDNFFKNKTLLMDFDVIKIQNDMKNGVNGVIHAEFKNSNASWITYTKLNINDWYMISIVPNDFINQKSKILININIIVLSFIILIFICILIYIQNIKSYNKNALNTMAYIDELTGINNKNKFEIEVDKLIKNYKESLFAIVFLDIDNFKTINELFGYDEGDSLLKHTAKCIQDEIHIGETCARFNGDNFYLFIQYIDKDHIRKRLRTIMDNISAYKFQKEKNAKYDIICYCGVYKVKETNIHKGSNFFVDRAKMAFLRIKKNHRNGYAFYNDAIRKGIVFTTQLENDMRDSLANREFEVYLQPKYNLATETISGAEALIRWEHHVHGFLTPDKFIPAFEKNGFITEIDMFVFEEVCRLQREWIDQGLIPVTISINQSRLNLYRKNYIESLQECIQKYNLPPSLIELEITESVASMSMDVLTDIVKKFHSIGFGVSMDDFGSGYSSLNLLKDVDVDVIKIDRVFMQETSNSEKGKEIIASIIDMADKLNISTVTEGVETIEQVKFLQSVRCDMAQGFYYARPMTIADFEKILKEKNNIII